MKQELIFSDGTIDYRIPTEPKVGEKLRLRLRVGRDEKVQVSLLLPEEENRTIPMEKAEQDALFDYYEARVLPGEGIFSYIFCVEYFSYDKEDGNPTEENCAGESCQSDGEDNIQGRETEGFFSCDEEGKRPAEENDAYDGRQSKCVFYYDRVGLTDCIRREAAFAVVPGFSTPDWAKGAVMYQILTDRFYNGDPTNDVLNDEYSYLSQHSRQVTNWRKPPAAFSVSEFYGGDLEGVRQKLDYLRELGVEALYFNPLFVSPSNHKYDTQDYDYIDPHFGKILRDDGELLSARDQDNTRATRYRRRVTDPENLEAGNALFAKLVEEAHSRGMRVILDGVFNHCGSFHKWMDREGIYGGTDGYEPGAYLSEDSPYGSYFAFEQKAWPMNPSYEKWWGNDTLPKLNYEGEKKLYQAILEIGKKWVSPPFDADGWRLDVAADLGHSEETNHGFWRDFRKTVKEAKPEALIFAEHYGDPKSWLMGDQWDSIMNYDAFMEPLTWFFTGMEKHSDGFDGSRLGDGAAFADSITWAMTRMLTPTLQCSMNELSNHDHSRFLTRTNHVVGRVAELGPDMAEKGIDLGVFKEAVIFQMTWPGAPTVYYGDEAGLCGFTDPDNRRTYPWGEENKEVLELHKKAIALHKSSEAFRTGSVRILLADQNLFAFGRFNRREQFLVLFNNDSCRHTLELSVEAAGILPNATLVQRLFTTEEGHSVAPVTYPVEEGVLTIRLPKKSAVVLQNKKDFS